MLIAHSDESKPAKGWYTELFRSDLPAVGYANEGVNDPHYHRELREVYLVARGSSKIVVDGCELTLSAGDVIVIEPGEVHTFVENTSDYFHFVLHCPMIRGDKVLVQE
jgi:quercetin dioxygenase-like cupin family protein